MNLNMPIYLTTVTDTKGTHDAIAFNYSDMNGKAIVRSVKLENVKYYVANDVLSILDLPKTAISKYCELQEYIGGKLGKEIVGKSSITIVIPAYDVYRLILKSPIFGKRYTNWLCNDVLPTLNNKGAYLLQYG